MKTLTKQKVKSLEERRSVGRFVSTVPKNFRWRELWRHTKPSVGQLFVGALVKLFRISFSPHHGLGCFDIAKLEPNDVPLAIHEYFSEETSELESLGFSQTFASTIPVLGNGEIFSLIFSHSESKQIAELIYNRLEHNHVIELQTGATFSSRALKSRTIYSTTNIEHGLDLPSAGCSSKVLPKASISTLYRIHQKRIKKAGERLQNFRQKHMWNLIIDRHKLELADQISRGAIAEVTPKQAARILSHSE